MIRRGVAHAPTADARLGAKSHLCAALLKLRRYPECRDALEDVLAEVGESQLKGNLLLMRANVRRNYERDMAGARADEAEARRLLTSQRVQVSSDAPRPTF